MCLGLFLTRLADERTRDSLRATLGHGVLTRLSCAPGARTIGFRGEN
jgi:hypothetical protein